MDDKLREIIESKKDDREVAEFAGITLTLAQYDYLIEQAELSREWQLVATDRFNDWYKADQLNNRYKQALEFYADKKNHEVNVTKERFGPFSHVDDDSGKIARKELEGDK